MISPRQPLCTVMFVLFAERYRDFRHMDGTYTDFHWELMVWRLGFVIVFEHIVFGISQLVSFLVPDVPESVEISLSREKFLSREIMADVHIVDLVSPEILEQNV